MRLSTRALGVPAAILSLTLARGAEPAPIDDALRALAAKETPGGRIVRIGLDPAHAVRISSKLPFRIVDPLTGRPVWRDSFTGFVAAVAEGGPEGSPRTIYRVQAGAFSTAEAAEAERDRLSRVYGAPAVVHYVPDRGSWRVRLGEAADREALGPLVDRLRADHVEGVWITDEPSKLSGTATLRLVDSSYNSLLAPAGRLAALPGGAPLEVEGKPYRGIVELRLNRFGAVQPVNWLETEAYLAGVVPAEMGPEVWPQLEALKAQAVAARTYLVRNLGQFDEDGYDLCATPRCQVYSGISAEHPLSDRAVAATRGESLSFDGRPISALYTATCGGHTEDGWEIFPEERGPYLKGVPCRAEAETVERLKGRLVGRAQTPRAIETGEDVTRDWAVLSAAGVVGESADPAAAVAPEELTNWVPALLRLAGRPSIRPAPPRAGSRLGELARWLVDAVGWSDRAQILLGGGDPPVLVRDPAASAAGEPERRALSLLVLAGALRPFADGTFGIDRVPSKGRVASALARVGDAYESFGLKDAVVSAISGGRVRLIEGKGSVELEVAPLPFLFALGGDRAVPAKTLDLLPGDRVRYRVGRDGRVDFLELRPPVKGIADDRAAKLYSWEVRLSRGEVEEAIRRRLDLGRLQDLKVVRRGVSGRIVELSVVGSRGSSVVKGFDVRTLLGLRESLAVIEPQRDADGEITAVVFAGKGWGHGVGLCQVGAYGMALRGADYREILAHYYSGAQLDAAR